MSLARARRELAAQQIIQQAIQEGVVPSANDVLERLAKLDAIRPFDELDTEPVNFSDGTRISSKRLNAALDAIEEEIEAAIESLNDSWLELEIALNNSEKLVEQAESARRISGEVRRMLALTEFADAYRTSKSIALSNIDDFDTANSDDMFVDTTSGVMKIAATDITFKPFTATLGEIYQESSGDRRSGVNVGDPSYINRPGYGARHIVQIVSSDPNDVIVLTYNVSLTDHNESDRYLYAQDVSTVEIDTSSAHPVHVKIEGTYDGLNWEELGQAWGNEKIIIVGASQKATDLRVTIRKTQYDVVVAQVTALKYGYLFDTGQIRVGIATYESKGTMYTKPIQLSDTGLATIAVDATVSTPTGTRASLFVAEEIEGSDPDTLVWKQIKPNTTTDISLRNQFSRTKHIDEAPKYLEGSGSLFDLWMVDTANESLTGMVCGINQAQMRVANDTLSSVKISPSTSQSSPFDSSPVCSLNSRITLAGHTIYRIEFSVWADNGCSAVIGLQSGTPSNTIIAVNGANVTNAWKKNEVSVGLSQGRNKVVVIVGSAVDSWVQITTPPGLTSAIERPILKDYTKIVDGEAACAQKDTKIITNFDPANMNVQIDLLNQEKSNIGTIRVKMVLETSDPTVTPTLSDLFVIAGV